MIVVIEKDGYMQGYPTCEFFIDNGELVINRDHKPQLIFNLNEKIKEIIVDGNSLYHEEAL